MFIRKINDQINEDDENFSIFPHQAGDMKQDDEDFNFNDNFFRFGRTLLHYDKQQKINEANEKWFAEPCLEKTSPTKVTFSDAITYVESQPVNDENAIELNDNEGKEDIVTFTNRLFDEIIHDLQNLSYIQEQSSEDDVNNENINEVNETFSSLNQNTKSSSKILSTKNGKDDDLRIKKKLNQIENKKTSSNIKNNQSLLSECKASTKIKTSVKQNNQNIKNKLVVRTKKINTISQGIGLVEHTGTIIKQNSISNNLETKIKSKKTDKGNILKGNKLFKLDKKGQTCNSTTTNKNQTQKIIELKTNISSDKEISPNCSTKCDLEPHVLSGQQKLPSDQTASLLKTKLVSNNISTNISGSTTEQKIILPKVKQKNTKLLKSVNNKNNTNKIGSNNHTKNCHLNQQSKQV